MAYGSEIHMAQGIEVLRAALDRKRIRNPRLYQGLWMEWHYDHRFYFSSTGGVADIRISDLWGGNWIIESSTERPTLAQAIAFLEWTRPPGNPWRSFPKALADRWPALFRNEEE